MIASLLSELTHKYMTIIGCLRQSVICLVLVFLKYVVLRIFGLNVKLILIRPCFIPNLVYLFE
jgi:hypothetical protein